MSLCDRCISGVRHEGIPEGTIEVINGVNVYVATPTGDYSTERAVLFLSDVFGIALENNRLLADDFARNGLRTYIVDYLNDDPVPPDALQPGSTYDLPSWIRKHGQAVTRPPLDAVIAGLREQGVTQFAATGFCYGARYAFDLAFDDVVRVVAVSHPSLLQIPGDLERFRETGVPLLINSCEEDSLFPLDAQARADEILGGGSQTSALYRREYFPGCAHGFAVRGDMTNPAVRAGKEGAFRATIEFFSQHL